MFESAELGHKIDKATFDAEEPALRRVLLDAQAELAASKKFSVLILINGVDGAGKGETVNRLNEWMDPRHIQTRAFDEPTPEEADRPPLWRYWSVLPPKGKIGIFFGSWYTGPIVADVVGPKRRGELDKAMRDIVMFERMLTNEGVLLLKFWFHLSKKAQKRRFRTLEKDRRTRWRVSSTEWKNFKHYDEFKLTCDEVLRATSAGEAPWIVVEGADERYRSLTVGKALAEAMRRRLDQRDEKPLTLDVAPLMPPVDKLHVLDSLDLTRATPKKEYEAKLEELQGRLALLTRDPRFKRARTIAVFEGVDAAGKGGAIRRAVGGLDARHYSVVPIAAPTDEERAQPYLWRFWRHIPRRGHLTIFDRSWYGRVLVERVEGFCRESDFMRAYSEINDFEAQLVANGTTLIKFWMQISKEEQLRRFEERQSIEFKRFKLGPEDWRNRDKWTAYEEAVSDMVDRTSTASAPWTLVEANDKYYARLKVLRTLCDRIEAAL
ncbi:MAG: polyphosphate:AMP phosphotransferase [Polyangiaceae bacterium]